MSEFERGKRRAKSLTPVQRELLIANYRRKGYRSFRIYVECNTQRGAEYAAGFTAGFGEAR